MEAFVRDPLGARSLRGAFEIATPKRESSTPKLPSARLGWIGLVGVIASGLALALSAGGTDVLLPDSLGTPATDRRSHLAARPPEEHGRLSDADEGAFL